MGQQRSTPDDPLLTVKALAEREGLSEGHVRFLMRERGLPHYKVGGVKIRLSEWKAWLESKRLK